MDLPNGRCIKGSTLLHTACYFNKRPAVQRLVALEVNLDVRDFRGKTALHRTRNIEIIKVRYPLSIAIFLKSYLY